MPLITRGRDMIIPSITGAFGASHGGLGVDFIITAPNVARVDESREALLQEVGHRCEMLMVCDDYAFHENTYKG